MIIIIDGGDYVISYDKEKARTRLRALRGNLSQRDLAEKLAGLVRERALDGLNGKQTVSQLELGKRGITLDYAFAYAEIFNVSLDYVLGRSDEWEPAYKSAKDVTGLSDEAIRAVEDLTAQREFDGSGTLSQLLSYGLANMSSGLAYFISEYCDEKVKADGSYSDKSKPYSEHFSNAERKEVNYSSDGMIEPAPDGFGKPIPGLFKMTLNLDSYLSVNLRKFGDAFVDLIKEVIDAEMQKKKEAATNGQHNEA